MRRNGRIPLAALTLCLAGCPLSGGGGGSASSSPPGGDAAAASPSAQIEILSVAEVFPAVFRIDYRIVDESGALLPSPDLLYSIDGGASFSPTTTVGESYPDLLFGTASGADFFLEWNSAQELGIQDIADVRLRVSFSIGEDAISAESEAFSVLNQSDLTDFRNTLFPEFADIVDQASPKYAGVLASLTVSTASGAPDIRELQFQFVGAHCAGCGTPSNVCSGCGSWYSENWTVSVSLYVLAGSLPGKIMLLDVLGGADSPLWSSSFLSLFPEFDDGSIVGAGSGASVASSVYEEMIYKLVRSQNVGVAMGGWTPAGGGISGSSNTAMMLSFDESLATGNLRWATTVGIAESMMRAITATEIVLSAPSGSLPVVVQGISKKSWGAAIAAAADPRILGALVLRGDKGAWDLYAQSGLQHFNPSVQPIPDAIVNNLLALGYPLHAPLGLVHISQMAALPNGPIWKDHLDSAPALARILLQGKPCLVQAGGTDQLMECHSQQIWFFESLKRRYPGSPLWIDWAPNFDHGEASPQDFKNTRSFAATGFSGRPRASISLAHETGPGGEAIFRAQVENPDPAKIEIGFVRLRYGFDEDDDWRIYGIGGLATDPSCTMVDETDPLICSGSIDSFPNRNFLSLPMTPTANPGEYELALDLSAIGGSSDTFLAFVAEVEDRALPGAFPSLLEETRAYSTSEIVFLKK